MALTDVIGDDKNGDWQEDLYRLGQLDAQDDIVQCGIVEVLQVRPLILVIRVLFLRFLPGSGLG